jgi:hypothetical protein
VTDDSSNLNDEEDPEGTLEMPELEDLEDGEGDVENDEVGDEAEDEGVEDPFDVLDEEECNKLLEDTLAVRTTLNKVCTYISSFLSLCSRLIS